MMVGMLLDMVIVLKFSKLASMSFTSRPTVYCIFFNLLLVAIVLTRMMKSLTVEVVLT